MKINQFINFQCDSCGKVKTFGEKSTIKIINREGRAMRDGVPFSFTGSAVRLGLDAQVNSGWVVLSHKDADGRFTRYTNSWDLPKRIDRDRLSLVCSGCVDGFEPPFSAAAERELAKVDSEVKAELLRLRAEVAELRQEVGS